MALRRHIIANALQVPRHMEHVKPNIIVLLENTPVKPLRDQHAQNVMESFKRKLEEFLLKPIASKWMVIFIKFMSRKYFFATLFFIAFLNNNLFAQNDLSRFDLIGDQKGSYAFQTVFYWKPFGVSETYTYHYQYFQQINDSQIVNDKAVFYTTWNDTLYLMDVQNKDSLYAYQRTHYDTLSLSNTSYGMFLRFISNNLRRFYDFSGRKEFPFTNKNDTSYYTLDGTDIPILSYSNCIRNDSSEIFRGKCEFMDIMSGDTLYQAWQIFGSQISNDSFEQVFQQGMNAVRELNSQGLKPKPAPIEEADTVIPAITLNEDWLKRIESHNISNTPLGDFSNGKTKVFFFTYNGCIPCMMAKPYIKKALQNDSLEIIVVNGVDRDSADIMHRLERDSLNHVPVIMANKELMTDFQVSPHPTLLVFDSKGNQLFREEGFSEEFYQKFFEE